MKKQLIFLLCTSVLSVYSTLSVAGPHHGKAKFFNMFDSDGDSIVTLDEMTTAGKTRFTNMDADANGMVSHEEFKQHMGEHRKAYKQKKFSMIDTNGDSQVSQEEFINYKAQKAEKRFTQKDTNGDGQLSMDEFSTRHKRHQGKGHHGHDSGHGKGHHKGKRIFNKLDANGDEQITMEEAMAGWTKWFTKLDADGDQIVTADEVKHMRMKRHSK